MPVSKQSDKQQQEVNARFWWGVGSIGSVLAFALYQRILVVPSISLGGGNVREMED